MFLQIKKIAGRPDIKCFNIAHWYLRIITRVSRDGRGLEQGGKNLRREATNLSQGGRTGESAALAPKIWGTLHMLIGAAQVTAEVTRAAIHKLPHALQRLKDPVGGVALKAVIEIVHQEMCVLRILIAEFHEDLVDVT